MELSNMDKFCEKQQIATTGTTVSEKAPDFGGQGDDIMYLLFIFVLVTTAMAGTGKVDIVMQSCAAEGFGSDVKEFILAQNLVAANLTKGAFPVANAPLPKGLLRYNRLAFKVTLAEGESITTAPAFSSYITDNRVEPLL